MYTNRIDTAGNPINEIDIENIPIHYESMNGFYIVSCPQCGLLNYVSIDWYGNVQPFNFCSRCGKEL